MSVLGCWLAALVVASPAARAVHDLSIVGFSPSGELVYAETNDEEAFCVLQFRDLRTNATRSVDCSGRSVDSAVEEWERKQHQRLTKAQPSRVSPDKTATLSVELDPGSLDGTWSGGSWHSALRGSWSYWVTRGETKSRVAQGPGGDSVTTYWSLDGGRTIWLVHHAPRFFRDPSWDELLIGSAGAPTVAIAAADVHAGEKLSGTLADAGFAVVNVSKALKPRKATVIYFAKNGEAVARELAERFPGAAVEPLSWASTFDVVIALGD